MCLKERSVPLNAYAFFKQSGFVFAHVLPNHVACLSLNPLSPSIKLQISFCVSIYFLQKYRGEAVKISIEFNLSDLVLNSHDLTN